MPTPQDYLEALLAVISTGESRRVGSTLLDPRKEYPRSPEGLMAYAEDLARAEGTQDCGRCG